jgi:hypothetical protein
MISATVVDKSGILSRSGLEKIVGKKVFFEKGAGNDCVFIKHDGQEIPINKKFLDGVRWNKIQKKTTRTFVGVSKKNIVYVFKFKNKKSH